jgi:hypothetical protein|tara:strand:+ start:4065 stop:4190 length:126 start_codon:yes stop_codon:yes gene_type:complete
MPKRLQILTRARAVLGLSLVALALSVLHDLAGEPVDLSLGV